LVEGKCLDNAQYGWIDDSKVVKFTFFKPYGSDFIEGLHTSEGLFDDGLSGIGKAFFDNGDIFIGEFNDGMIPHIGRRITIHPHLKSTSYFDGKYKNLDGNLVNESGIYTFSNESIFNGTIFGNSDDAEYYASAGRNVFLKANKLFDYN